MEPMGKIRFRTKLTFPNVPDNLSKLYTIPIFLCHVIE